MRVCKPKTGDRPSTGRPRVHFSTFSRGFFRGSLSFFSSFFFFRSLLFPSSFRSPSSIPKKSAGAVTRATTLCTRREKKRLALVVSGDETTQGRRATASCRGLLWKYVLKKSTRRRKIKHTKGEVRESFFFFLSRSCCEHRASVSRATTCSRGDSF